MMLAQLGVHGAGECAGKRAGQLKKSVPGRRICRRRMADANGIASD